MAGNLAPGRTVAIILYENAWASKVADAIAAQNGEVLVQGRVRRAVIEELVAEASRRVATEPRVTTTSEPMRR